MCVYCVCVYCVCVLCKGMVYENKYLDCILSCCGVSVSLSILEPLYILHGDTLGAPSFPHAPLPFVPSSPLPSRTPFLLPTHSLFAQSILELGVTSTIELCEASKPSKGVLRRYAVGYLTSIRLRAYWGTHTQTNAVSWPLGSSTHSHTILFTTY